LKRGVWSVDEIGDILAAANEATEASAAVIEAVSGEDARALGAYRQGFKAALVTVALAFGLSPLDASHSLAQAVLPSRSSRAKTLR